MESNPMRWVVLGLVAAVAFALALIAFVENRVARTRAEAEAASAAMAQQMEEAERRQTARLDAAAAVAAPFITAVGAGRFAEAHALLAAPYRQAVSIGELARACRASPMLAGARRVTLRQLREDRRGAAVTLEAHGMLESTAGTVPIGFVFLQEEAGPRVLVVSLAGVPVLQGVMARAR